MSAALDDRRPLVRTLHLAVLWSFAVAQPLFDLLARDAAFFVVRRSKPVDLVLLAAAMVLVAPLLVALAPLLGRLIWKPLGSALHHALVAILCALVILPPLLRALPETSDGALLVLAGLAGLAALVLYTRWTLARTFLTVMSPAPILFAAAFLLTPSIRKVVSPPETEIVAAAQGARSDLVMLVLDELPLAALLDRDGGLDAELFPGFARLAARTTWLRNASASHESTTWVVPSLLSGRLPGGDDELPIAFDHPRSLFTLLGDSHRMKVIETITDICPDSLSGEGGEGEPLVPRLRSLAQDLGLVLAHLLVPPSYVAQLPSISGNWGSFWRDVTSQRERADSLQRFLDELDDSDAEPGDERPTLHFLHVLLPHIPYAYLPSGKQYTHPDAVVDPHEFASWPTEPWWAAQALQRFLLQLSMVDGLIDQLLDRLDETGLSQSAVLVVTADHGASFSPGGDRRKAGPENLDDILYVPLFVGRPGQTQGLIFDRNVESIDLLPTLADLLEVPLPWRVDGVSAFAKTTPPRERKTLARRVGEPLTASAELPRRRPLREHMGQLFGEPLSWAGIHALGSRPQLVGRSLASLQVVGNSAHRVILDGSGAHPLVTLGGDTLPAYLSGRLQLATDEPAPEELTMVVNGSVVATVPVISGASAGAADELVFTAMLPETSFIEGRNSILLLTQDKAGRWWQLGDSDWQLTVAADGIETLSAGTERVLSVDRTAVHGALDLAEANHGVLHLAGWAVNLADGSPATDILVFEDGACVFAGTTGRERRDAGEIAGAEAARSGFELELPLSLVGDLSRAPLRVFATAGDAAAELAYSDEASWVSLVQHYLEDGVLLGSDGSRITPRVGPLDGVLDTALIEEDRLNLLGWAADREHGRNAEWLLVLVDGRQVYAGRVWLERPTLAQDLGDPALHHAGFHHKLPLAWFDGPPDGRVQLFALSGDQAVELRPTEDAEWVTPRRASDMLLLDPRSWNGPRWSLSAAQGEAGTVSFSCSDGSTAALTPWSLQGALDAAVDDGESLRLLGWAVDGSARRPVEHVVVLLDGQFLVAASPWLERADVTTALGDEALLSCGFQLVLPREALPTELEQHLSVVAVSGALAMELPLGPDARWLELPPEASAAAALQGFSVSDEGLLGGSGQLWPFAETLDSGSATTPSSSVDGALDSALLKEGQLLLQGWACDRGALLPATAIAVLRDGALLAVVTPNSERRDLVQAFGSEALARAGFSVSLAADGDQTGRIAIYALVGEVAQRLRSSAGAAWVDAER